MSVATTKTLYSFPHTTRLLMKSFIPTVVSAVLILALNVNPVRAADAVPALLTPAANATLPNGTFEGKNVYVWEFTWAPVTGATAYELWVIGGKAKFPAVSKELKDTSYRHLSRGYVGHTNLQGWSWKVRAQVQGVWQPWSASRKFNVLPLPLPAGR
jgi:hypothetical protein